MQPQGNISACRYRFRFLLLTTALIISTSTRVDAYTPVHPDYLGTRTALVNRRDPLSQQQAQVEPLIVGSLDLEAYNIDAGEARAISDRLRYYLGRQPIFLVIERNRMESIMNEVGFQFAGVCDTDECVIEVGKILGASKMIAGSVSKVGTLYSLQVRLIDIQSSSIEHQAVEDVRGIEEVLQIATNNVALQLAQSVMRQFEGAQPVPVQLDTVQHEPEQPPPATTTQLGVVSSPSRASITFDGQPIRETTPTTFQVTAGSHELLVEKEGYQPYTATIEITGGELRAINVELEAIPVGFANIISDPEGFTVVIDGTEVGVTPLRRFRLAEGAHRVELLKEGYDSATWSLEIHSDETAELNVKRLRSGRAELTLNSRLRGASITIDGVRKTSVTPAEGLVLRPGRYTIEVKAPGYAVWRQTLEVEDGDKEVLTVDLRPKSRIAAGTLSLLIPGLGQFYARRPVTGAIYLLVQGALGVATVMEFIEYMHLQDEYADHQVYYDRASTTRAINIARDALDRKHHEVYSSHDMLTKFGYAIGALWLLNVFDAAVLMPQLPTVESAGIGTSVNARASSGKILIALTLHF